MTKQSPIAPNPQELIQMFEQFQEDIKKHNDAQNKALKQLFQGKIKQSFLIEMKEKIFHKTELSDLMTRQYGSIEMTQEDLLLGRENSALDICKFITMIHFFNTITSSNEERAELQDDKEYKEKLLQQVVDAVKLRNLALVYNSRTSLEGYYPLTFAIYALNNFWLYKCGELYKTVETLDIKNAKFRYKILYRMTLKIKAALLMIDNDLFEEAYNHLRSLVELFLAYLVLFDADEEAINAYNNHSVYQIRYQDTHEIPKELVDVVDNYNNKYKGLKLKTVDYLNYGWLDKIFMFVYIPVNERKYRIIDLVKLVDMKYEKEHKKIGTLLYSYYQKCSPLSHGSNVRLNRYNSKITVTERLAYILNSIDLGFEILFNVKSEMNGINIADYLNKIYHQQLEYDKKIVADKELLKSLDTDYVHRIK